MQLTDINDRHLQAYLAGRTTADELRSHMTVASPFEFGEDGELRVLPREDYLDRVMAAMRANPRQPKVTPAMLVDLEAADSDTVGLVTRTVRRSVLWRNLLEVAHSCGVPIATHKSRRGYCSRYASSVL